MTAVWTAACLSADMPPGTVLQSSCDGAELAVWRSAQGKVSAWNDRCQHRGMRLSHGFVRGEALSCIYHGWVYGTSGACSRIPAHPDLIPPDAIRAAAFACREAHGVVWVAPLPASGSPPDLGALEGLRSVVVIADTARLTALLPKGFTALADGVFRTKVDELSDLTLTIVLQPLPEARLRLHVLTDAGLSLAAKTAASRWLEALRRTAETEAVA